MSASGTPDLPHAKSTTPRPRARVWTWLRQAYTRLLVHLRAVFSFARQSRPRSRLWMWLRQNLVLVVVFFGIILTYATLDYPEVFTARPEAQGDGVYYYAWARSLALDGDIDMANDYRIIGNPGAMGAHPKTKHIVNTFPMGTGVLQVPTVWLARAVLPLTNRLGWTHDNLQGGSVTFQRIAHSSSAILGFFGVVLGILLARRAASGPAALAGGLGVLFASPLLWYMLRQPHYSHAIDGFAVALFVYFWWRTHGRLRLDRWLGIGALLGLAALVRPQNVCHGVVVAIEGVFLAAASFRSWKSRWRWLGYWLLRAALFGLGSAMAFLPQMLAWRYMFGAFLTIPQGGSYMVWNQSRWGGFLFSARFGLFAWHPLLGLGLLGLIVPIFLRRTPAPLRRLLLACLVAFAAHTFINGMPEDWWGHWSFGGRRGVGAIVYLVIGLSIAMHGLAGFLERYRGWLTRLAPFALVGLCAWLNLSLMDDYLLSRAKHEVTQPMKPLWSSALNKAMDAVYALTGNWGSIPDNWRFAAAAHVSPERYDTAAALDFDPGHSLPFTVPLSSPDHAMGGFGEPTTVEARPCRWIDGDSGHWVYVLRRPMALRGTVTMAPATPGTKVRMRIGGQVVLSSELSAGFHEYPIAIPKSRSSGVVVVAVEQLLAKAPASWPVALTSASLPYEVELTSTGFGVGSRVLLNLGPHTREEIEWGLHLFVLDPGKPSVRRWERFDTHLSTAEVDRFAAVVDSFPNGTVVAVAVAYDASSSWTTIGDKALAALGGTSTLAGKIRQSFALIGAKGAAPGTAAEAMKNLSPVKVLVGRSVADRHNGVAYQRVVLGFDPQGE